MTRFAMSTLKPRVLRACRITVGRNEASPCRGKDDRPIVAVARHVDTEALLRPRCNLSSV
jgi:hypothetical protein